MQKQLPRIAGLVLAMSISSALAQTAPTAPTAAERVADVELISRDALFGNPERALVMISPDGKTLSWIAPVDGVMNVWVAPADNPAQARAVTDDDARGIRRYFWSYQPDTLLYLRDTGGDEDFHLYSVNIATGEETDLTPFPKTTAQVVAASHSQPGTILVGMNDRDPAWHDLYKVDLATGERTLLEKNDDRIGNYLVDDSYTLRYATRARPDGGSDILQPDGQGGWKVQSDIPFEDSLTTAPAGLTTDGDTLYMLDSRGRDTAALYAVDVASGERTLVREDARADVGQSLTHPRTGEVQAVSVNYLREEWQAVDPAIKADLEKLQAIGPGEIGVNSRTHDDNTWIVTYAAAEDPVSYYRYDRGAGGTLTKLFSARPSWKASRWCRCGRRKSARATARHWSATCRCPGPPMPTTTARPMRRCRWCCSSTVARGRATATATAATTSGWPTAATPRCRSTSAAPPASARTSPTPATASGPARCTTT